MNFYSYSESTGEYLGEGIAQESPLEPGVYLIPANATQIEPPAASANQVAVFSVTGQQWRLFSDFRGTTYWVPPSLTPSTMTDIGELPQGSVTVTPPAEEANTKIEFSNGTWTTVPDFIRHRVLDF